MIAAVFPAWRANAREENVFVGSAVCAKCHEAEYGRYRQYAKKAHSYESVKLMKKGLSEAEFHQCLECHTTGYGKPGGFVSEEETPQLKDAGCEVCHGPGSIHSLSREKNDIKKNLTLKDCEKCHNGERVEAFHYKPLIFGGAH